MNKIQIVQTSIQRKPARKRGPFSSEEYNNFQDQVARDLVNLATAVNTNANNIIQSLEQLYSENQYLRRRIEALEEENIYREFYYGKSALRVNKQIDFRNSEPIIFPTTLPQDKATSYKAQFGELSLPVSAIENKFYNFSLRTREVVIPDDFSYEVSGQFDKGDGNGIQDYEKGGKVSQGEPKYAFNGIDDKVWQRRVSFPLESDVDEVEVEITAIVPSGISSKANLAEIITYPEGSVDVMSVSTSPDLTSSFTTIEGFSAVNNSVATRYHFTPRNVDQVRIRLRCRTWQEIRGQKVFIYGLREFGLKLVDYKKSYKTPDAFGDNYTAVVEVKAPSSHVFGNLYRVDPRPNFLLEDSDLRHIRLRLSTTQDFSGVFWDSEIDIPPQLGVISGVSMGSVSTIYAIYTFKFVDSSGGYNSPFYVGATPWARGLGLVYGLTSTNANN
jgi:hypothetical protein